MIYELPWTSVVGSPAYVPGWAFRLYVNEAPIELLIEDGQYSHVQVRWLGPDTRSWKFKLPLKLSRQQALKFATQLRYLLNNYPYDHVLKPTEVLHVIDGVLVEDLEQPISIDDVVPTKSSFSRSVPHVMLHFDKENPYLFFKPSIEPDAKKVMAQMRELNDGPVWRHEGGLLRLPVAVADPTVVEFRTLSPTVFSVCEPRRFGDPERGPQLRVTELLVTVGGQGEHLLSDPPFGYSFLDGRLCLTLALPKGAESVDFYFSNGRWLLYTNVDKETS